MWSNVEVCSQMGAGHTHLEEWGGRATAHVQWGVGETSMYTSEQMSALVTHSYSYVLTCRLGLGCIGNTGCYTVQWGQLGLGQIGQHLTAENHDTN